MTAYAGRDFLLQINISNTYTTIGGMRTTSLSLNNKPVDVSNKSTGAWQALLPGAGIRKITLSASGLFENSAAEESVRAAAFASTALDCKLRFANNSQITGLFLVTAYDRAGEHDGEETYSITLESAGNVTYS
jgi:TP901-1 family phage major tail protein